VPAGSAAPPNVRFRPSALLICASSVNSADRRSRERGLDYLFDCRGARKLHHVIKILEAIWTSRAELGNGDCAANCGRRFSRLRDAGVSDGAVIVISQQHDAGALEFRP
jgi:hypothetical protein